MEGISQKQNYKKPSAGAVIGGVIVGSTVQNITSTPHKIFSNLILNKIEKINKNLSSDEFSKVEKAVVQTFKDSGLKNKGVSVIKATSENIEEVSKIMSREFDINVIKYLPKKVKDILGSLFASQFKNGTNACYAHMSKNIIVPEKGLGLAFFHEAGHAMNANLSKFGKILQGSRSLTLLSLPIATIALWKTQKAPGEKPKNGLDKATTFVKNNAGKLTFATFLPIILEEGMASIKGNNCAKKLLNPELAKKVVKANAFGFSTYLSLATLSSVGIYLGAKVKDSIAKKKLAPENK